MATREDETVSTVIINVDDDEVAKDPGAPPSSSGMLAASSSTRLGKRTAPVYNKVRGSKKAALELLRNPAKRKAAMEAYRRDKRSAGDTSCFNLATWEEYHKEWYDAEPGLNPPAFPLTPEHIEAVGCVMKGSDYRSTYNYLNAAKRHHQRLGFQWDDRLELAGREFTMSTQRGLGPARQSEPLAFERLIKTDIGDAPLNSSGPVGPKNAMVLFTYFLVRGVEGPWLEYLT